MLKEEKDNPDENREEEEDKEATIMVRTDGSAETAASNTNGVYWKRREQELIEHLKEKDSIILQQQQEMAGLEEEAQYYKQIAEQSVVPVASEPREPLQHQGELPTKTILNHQDIEPSMRNLKFEFWLPFNALRIEMDRLYRKHGTAAKIWINGAVDIATGRVLRVNIGRSENAARADEHE